MKSRFGLLVTLSAGLAIGVALSITGTFLAGRGVASAGTQVATAAPTTAKASAAIPWEDARLLAEVLQRVRENYVDDVDDHRLMKQAAHGLVESLDEYSTFLDGDEYQDLRLSTSGSYSGIGIEVDNATDGIRIVNCIAGSPAEVAGLRNNDVIIAIDDRPLVLSEIDAAINSMRGAPGTSVALRVRRGEQELDFIVTRSQVELPSVAAQLLAPGYGFMRISSFTDATAPEFLAAWGQLQNSEPLKGLVIDLRNNPGGVLDAAIAVADQLLDKGIIVSAQGRADDARFVTQAEPGDIAAGTEIVLLVNGGSASAAEILAAALHDNQRAVLIGRRTYGKGSVQTIMPLSGGQALKLTTSRYFTPTGASINRRGIDPDVELDGVEQPPADLDTRAGNATLASRDHAVGVALQMLRTKVRVASGSSSARPRS